MEILKNILRGLAIGLANIIPGVSGGTMALVLGIYQRLLNAISNIGPESVKAISGGVSEIREELKRIDAIFLASLGAGAAIAIIAAAKIMAYLFENHHDPTYGFFFGLVLISIAVPLRMIKRISMPALGATFVAIVLVVGLTMTMSGEDRLQAARKKAQIKAQQNELTENIADKTGSLIPTDARTVAFFFLSGIIAISAMILPGISGSFMMLLMGVYFDILICINERQLIPLLAFGLGCVIGILAFTRFLNYLLKKYHDLTMSFLLGLVLGSLYAIWPFKTFGMAGGKRVDINNIIPANFGQNELLTLSAALAGCALVGIFIYFENIQSKKPAE